MDNSEAVNVGGLRQGTKSVKAVKPRFTADFPEAVIGEGTEELTLRAEEVGSSRSFIDTTHVEAERWTSASECGLACQLSSHSPGSQGTRLEDDVLHLP